MRKLQESDSDLTAAPFVAIEKGRAASATNTHRPLGPVPGVSNELLQFLAPAGRSVPTGATRFQPTFSDRGQREPR